MKKAVQEDFTPDWLGVFDSEKIAFVHYDDVDIIFDEYKTADFNWNVTPSDTTTKEFKMVAEIVRKSIKTKIDETNGNNGKKGVLFNFVRDEQKIIEWIKENVRTRRREREINDRNFPKVYEM